MWHVADLFIGLGRAVDSGVCSRFALRFSRHVLVLVLGFPIVSSVMLRRSVVDVVVVAIAVTKVPPPVNDAYFLRCEMLEEAAREVQCAVWAFWALQDLNPKSIRNRSRKTKR